MNNSLKHKKKIKENFSKEFSESLKKILLDEEKNDIFNQKEKE